GVNPYVLVPKEILEYLFSAAGRTKGPIPLQVMINKTEFDQTLVRYSGKWRLYLNTPMRKLAKNDVGDIIIISLDYNSKDRIVPLHPIFEQLLSKNKKAKEIFEKLAPSRQKEISRYLNNLKTDQAIQKNVVRAINFLQGRERFVGRDNPW